MGSKRKLCFVVQRYGNEIYGGAEALCKQYADRLKAYYDIQVLTSCSLDYDTWENEYRAGKCKVDGIPVMRFPSVKLRSHEYTRTITPPVYDDPYHDMETAAGWLKSIGPECPELIQYVIEHRDDFDLFVFIGYMYYTTTMVMPYVADKAVLIPTSHDEDALNRCNYFKMQFNLPRAMIPLTTEEEDMIRRKFHNHHIPMTLGGAGVEIPPEKAMKKTKVERKYKIEGDYIVYIGRIDETKFCQDLFEQVAYYQQKYDRNITLAAIGKELMEIPEGVIATGFIDEIDKFALLSKAKALVLPSKVESLSMVTLEAMALGVPVLLRAQSEVLKAHIDKSGAGRAYYEKEDFSEALHDILTREDAAREMGERGKKYIKENFEWPVIISRIQQLFDRLIQENDSHNDAG